MFVPGIMASRLLPVPGVPQSFVMDMEDSDPDSYLPFFDWQDTAGDFELLQQFLVLDNGAKSNTPQEGVNYLRVGKTFSYASGGIDTREIRFSIPGGASGSPLLSLWYRSFYSTSDTSNISVVQYPDGTYIGADSTDIMFSASVLSREYTWTNVTSPLVAGKFYELILHYQFRTSGSNFPSDQRPTVGGVYDATHNMGECLVIDNIEVTYDI